MMKITVSTMLAAAMLVSNAFGATTAAGALAPGKPAGVHLAQAQNTTLLWVLGAGLVIGGIALVATNGGDQTPTGSTTSATTSTAP